MTWTYEPQRDNNGLEVGIAGLMLGWVGNGQERLLVAASAGPRLVALLNGAAPDARQERLEQPYLDAERVPRSSR